MLSWTRGLVAAAALVPAATATAQMTTFVAYLDQSQEVPTPTPTGATGTGTFTYDAMTGKITYMVTGVGLSGSGGTDCHIHTGMWGTAAGVTFTLVGGPTVYMGTTGVLTPAQVTSLFTGGNPTRENVANASSRKRRRSAGSATDKDFLNASE